MDMNKPPSQQNRVVTPDAKTYRLLLAERARRARRAEKIDRAVTSMLTDVIVISGAAWPLMLGLSGLRISASYWTCVSLVVAARITFGIRPKLRDE